MHEFAAVASIVDILLPKLVEAGVERVTQVYFRRGSTFSEDALRQAYAAAAAGTPLEGAHVIVDTLNIEYTCACGHRTVIDHHDLHGHMYVCPQCGAVHEIDEAHDLELLDVIAEIG